MIPPALQLRGDFFSIFARPPCLVQVIFMIAALGVESYQCRAIVPGVLEGGLGRSRDPGNGSRREGS